MSDPYLTLNVALTADDAEIRQAYLTAIRNYPPDRDADRFNTIRCAYDAIRDEKRRISYQLFNTEPASPNEILDRLAPTKPGKPPALKLFEAIMKEPMAS